MAAPPREDPLRRRERDVVPEKGQFHRVLQAAQEVCERLGGLIRLRYHPRIIREVAERRGVPIEALLDTLQGLYDAHRKAKNAERRRLREHRRKHWQRRDGAHKRRRP